MQSDFLPPSLMPGLVPLLLDICWKSLLVFAAAGLALLLLRRGSAAARHALWLSVFVGLLCLPVLCWWLPQRALPLLPAAVMSAAPPVRSAVAVLPSRPMAHAFSAPPAEVKAPAPAPPLRPAPPERRPAPINPAAWLALLWLAGAAAVLARTGLGLVSARRLVRGCVPVCTGPLAEVAEEARRALGLARPACLRQDTSGKAVAVPMTFGARRPVVLLPGGAAEWPAERARVVLLHEMAHVGRGDWAALVLAQIVCAVYWFQPLVWLATRRLRAEAEEACDDRVLACGVPAPDYAGHLLEIVRALPRRGGAPIAAVVTMAQTREIAGRLETILAPAKDRRAVSRRRLALALLAGLAVVVPVAAMHPARRHAPARVGAVAVPTGAPWTARLSDGTLIKLIAVTKADVLGQGIGAPWAPDGGPLGGSAAATRSPLVAPVRPSLDQADNISLRMTATPPKRYAVAAVSVSYTRRGHCGVEMRVSAGPFTTLVSAPLGRGASQRLPSGETVTLSRGITRVQAGELAGTRPTAVMQVWLTVPVRFNTPDYDSRMEALGPDGRPVNSPMLPTFPQGSEGSGPTRRLLYPFQTLDLKSRHITGFRFVTRPADHFTFHDVALYPNLPAGTLPPISQEFDPQDKDPAVRARARRQRIETALRLREQRRGWAERNAALLRRMRQAGPGDLAALLRVCAQVPPFIGSSSGDAPFSTLGAPPTLSHLRRSQGPLEVHLREDFSRYRDLRVSQSLYFAPTSITLWASGRVTETTTTFRVSGHPRVLVETTQETAEIAPAYPFLK